MTITPPVALRLISPCGEYSMHAIESPIGLVVAGCEIAYGLRVSSRGALRGPRVMLRGPSGQIEGHYTLAAILEMIARRDTRALTDADLHRYQQWVRWIRGTVVPALAEASQ